MHVWFDILTVLHTKTCFIRYTAEGISNPVEIWPVHSSWNINLLTASAPAGMGTVQFSSRINPTSLVEIIVSYVDVKHT